MSIALSSVAAFSAAVGQARAVDVCAYTLRSGPVRDALVVAARSGAVVRLRLERDPLDDAAGTLHQANANTVATLRAAGADAALTLPGEPVLHLKAAIVDGVAWLDDRNWAGGPHETVVRDSEAADVAVVAAGLSGESASNAHLSLNKAGAQLLEVGLIRSAGPAPLAVESESFGSGGVYNSLLARARLQLPTRLIVAGREATATGDAGNMERRRLAKLATLGCEVRIGDPARSDLDEKLAIAASAAWTGSANATYAHGTAGDQRDWGLATHEPAIVDGLQATFETNWRAAQPLPPLNASTGETNVRPLSIRRTIA